MLKTLKLFIIFMYIFQKFIFYKKYFKLMHLLYSLIFLFFNKMFLFHVIVKETKYLLVLSDIVFYSVFFSSFSINIFYEFFISFENNFFIACILLVSDRVCYFFVIYFIRHLFKTMARITYG